MKIKKYIAASMPEAMNQIRKELGPEAVILNSREIQQGGFFGMFKKSKIEVIAALDPQPIAPKPEQKPLLASNQAGELDHKEKLNERVLDELESMKKMIAGQVQDQGKFQGPFQTAYMHLLDQEVAPEIAEEVIADIVQHVEIQGETADLAFVAKAMKQEIAKKVRQLPSEAMNQDKKVIHFVGPTGVGKTTTIAKLAARSMLQDGKKVAFITMDTYRIAAIEQLKTYTNILDIPLEVAYSIDDYKKAVQKFAAYDCIFVDTAGRNYRNAIYVRELKANIDFGPDAETYLVLSLTAKQKDLLEIADQFQHLPIKALIFTKMDETRQFGSMLTLAMKKKMGIAYLSNGQNVPDDLIIPTPEIIGDLLAGELANG